MTTKLTVTGLPQLGKHMKQPSQLVFSLLLLLFAFFFFEFWHDYYLQWDPAHHGGLSLYTLLHPEYGDLILHLSMSKYWKSLSLSLWKLSQFDLLCDLICWFFLPSLCHTIKLVLRLDTRKCAAPTGWSLVAIGLTEWSILVLDKYQSLIFAKQFCVFLELL